ncbi:MAG TPA: polysaccharide deacetylase family protein, partial [Candidatus Methylomirabilis sp.]|nr:polysaccharide deacetylase family protein [Candidatus Methylomirabilis sp.]
MRAALRGLVAGGLERCGVLPLLRRRADPRRAVVLRYHSVSEPTPENLLYRAPSISVSPRTFERQMEFLADRYQVVPLARLVDCVAAGEPFPPRAVAITFDDGYRDNHRHALPCLRSLGLPATVFVTAGAVGDGWSFWVSRLRGLLLKTERAEIDFPGLGPMDLSSPAAREGWIEALTGELCRKPPPEAERDLAQLASLAGVDGPIEGSGKWMMGWEELREAAGAGIDIGAHTVSHPVLTFLDDGQAAGEISRSRKVLEKGLERPVLHFAYPNGPAVENQDLRVARLVREAGFLSACTSENGPLDLGDDRYRLRRLAVAERDAVHGLAFNLERDRLHGVGPQGSRPRPRLFLVGPPANVRTGISTCVRSIHRSELPSHFDLVHVCPTGRYAHYELGAAGKVYQLARSFLNFARQMVFRRPAAVQVHSSHYGDFWRNAPFILGAWVLRVPSVFVCHGSRFERFHGEAGPLKKCMIRFLLRRPRAILVRGSYWREVFSEIVPGARVELLPTTADPVEGRSRVPGSDPMVLYVGGNPLEEDARRKGLPDLLAVVPQVLARQPRARFRIVGPSLDSSWKGMLNEGEQAECVEFVGPVPPEKVSDLYLDATVFVLPSRAEGMP